MKFAVDPRHGDIEDDASSTKQRSLMSLAGSMLVEISPLKLALTWLMLLVIPGLLLGFAPIVATAWVRSVSGRIISLSVGLWSLLILLAFLLVGWYGARTLLRIAERNFWSLNAVVVEPVYGTCREMLRHIAERLLPPTASAARRSVLRSACAAIAGIIVCLAALAIIAAVWPSTNLYGDLQEILSPRQLVSATLSNSIALVAAYLAAGSLIWAAADTMMAQPRDLPAFHAPTTNDRRYSIAHLSDIHVVGERFGFRIESGRSGPRGNDRLARLFQRLEAIDMTARLDAILITGDVTDAGRSAEWAEFFEILRDHPSLGGRCLIIPGNHDLNIVDRANPARMDLPTSPNRRLRQIRTLSAMVALQGDRVHVVDASAASLGPTLSQAVHPLLGELESFADKARPLFSKSFCELWNAVFPMVLPPAREDGLGIILLNSNADTHFSFTNALGMISAEQVERIDILRKVYPRACWLIALHHHAIEYPHASNALSERIGTALVNGNWFIRRLTTLSGRALLLHGHRHIDWIGECEGLTIISAPSPVMEATDDQPTYFYVHTAVIDLNGQLKLAAPERIILAGQQQTITR
ncbi:metallophosphoesterase family protein [Mesorhizobium sp. 1B3]|uniref:metallophosphoesterase family protein n=1 Tax=Mesorhizobium sp. 1B3 TaxID=3243599 RepID=UPI003D95EDEC